MKLIIIAAVNNKRVIGKNGKTPWRIPEDLQRFKDLTAHHTVLMGRKTYESIGKPLPHRKSIVISHDLQPIEGVKKFQDIQSAFEFLSNEKSVFIIGGGEIFRQTIGLADELMLTIVDNEDEGDVYFPEYEHLDGVTFDKIYEEQRAGFTFRTLRRMGKT